MAKAIRKSISKSQIQKKYNSIIQNLHDLAKPSKNDKLTLIAHQRRRFAVHPPLLCRHLVIFFPYHKNPKIDLSKRPGDFVSGRLAAVEAVGALSALIIDGMPHHIRQIPGHPPPPDLIEKLRISRAELKKSIDNDINKTSSVRFRAGILNDYVLRLRANIHSEFLSVTFFLDKPDYSKEDDAPEYSSVESVINHWSGWITATLGEGSAIYKKLEVLHLGLWKAFDKFFNLEKIIKCEKTYVTDYPNMSLIGDFRGAAFSSGFGLPPAVGLDSQSHPYPGIRLWKRNFPSKKPRAYFLDESNYEIFLDFLGFNPDGTRQNPIMEAHRAEANVVLCNMLSGNAMYGSTLGILRADESKIVSEYRNLCQYFEKNSMPDPPNVLTEATDLPTPVTYFVIYNGQSAHQLGRLIHRLHVLGELRMAALLDYETIYVLNEAITELAQEVANALAFPERIDRKLVRSMISTYSAIGSRCHGGLAFRSRRCKDYLEILQFHAKDTKTKRINGWQSYTSFIDRNLIREFQTIISIGSRYEELGVRVDRVISLYQAEKSIKIANRSLSIAGVTLIGFYLFQNISDFIFSDVIYKNSLILIGTISAAIIAFIKMERPQFMSANDEESER